MNDIFRGVRWSRRLNCGKHHMADYIVSASMFRGIKLPARFLVGRSTGTAGGRELAKGGQQNSMYYLRTADAVHDNFRRKDIL